MLIRIEGYNVLDDSEEKRLIYINPLHVSKVEEFDDETCTVAMDGGNVYVVDASVNLVAMRINDELQAWRFHR